MPSPWLGGAKVDIGLCLEDRFLRSGRREAFPRRICRGRAKTTSWQERSWETALVIAVRVPLDLQFTPKNCMVKKLRDVGRRSAVQASCAE